ncbi:hypothetical protein M408DRAFT_331600 [Serendipita vermifera MAFF 305830]|uniref:PITH domain-containing protein n=1 Tax=Serendipita vermifera MAFF 305830 TaxID=933852 RepID=A0A0C3AJJ2_SERVB|nr:hypothetical protein M408DRAFT_331600 [Serendipita vermifera MAFF 305830]
MDEATPLDTPSESQAGYGDSTNLFQVVDRDKVNGLNLTVPEDAKELIKSWDMRENTEKYVDSGVDDQLIINVPFTQNVRLRSVLLKLGHGEWAPQRLRLYVNHPSGVGFDEADSLRTQLDIALLQGQSNVTEYPLRVAAFSNVFSISLFFSDAVGEEVTRMYYVGFKGDARQPTKDPNTHLDIAAEHSADAKVIDRLTEKNNTQVQIR